MARGDANLAAAVWHVLADTVGFESVCVGEPKLDYAAKELTTNPVVLDVGQICDDEVVSRYVGSRLAPQRLDRRTSSTS